MANRINLLNERYKIEKRINDGSQGIVFLAIDTKSKNEQ